jgi:hypothetical protein
MEGKSLSSILEDSDYHRVMVLKRGTGKLVIQEHATLMNEDETIGIQMWSTGHVDVMFRDTPSDSWGPPIRMKLVNHD